jgi:hypothetical protein
MLSASKEIHFVERAPGFFRRFVTETRTRLKNQHAAWQMDTGRAQGGDGADRRSKHADGLE